MYIVGITLSGYCYYCKTKREIHNHRSTVVHVVGMESCFFESFDKNRVMLIVADQTTA